MLPARGQKTQSMEVQLLNMSQQYAGEGGSLFLHLMLHSVSLLKDIMQSICIHLTKVFLVCCLNCPAGHEMTSETERSVGG